MQCGVWIHIVSFCNRLLINLIIDDCIIKGALAPLVVLI